MTSRIHRSLLLTILLGAPASLAACGGGSPAASATAQTSAPIPTIEVVRVVEKSLDITQDLPGELNPYEMVAVYPKVTGFVKTIRVDRGSRVRSGELLAELDAPEIVSQHAEAQSRLQAAQAQLVAARAKADADAGTYEKLKAASATPGVVAGNDLMLAQKALEADRSQVTASEQNVEAARQAVGAITQMESYLKVTAPFDGVVTERNVHPGSIVGPGSGPDAATALFRIVDNHRLRLVVPVPEAFAAGISTGASVSFTVASYPGQTFSGKVARLAQVVDAKTRTMAVELDVENGNGRLTAGSFCQVRWPVHRSAPSLLVPSRSVASTTGRTFVVRVKNDRTEWVDIKTGLSVGALVEVFGDLKPGDVVAARGTDELRAGTQVHTTDAKPPS